MKEIFVMVLVCMGEPDHPADKINYSLKACQDDGRGTAINLFLMSGKRCAYKCVAPGYEPPEIKK